MFGIIGVGTGLVGPVLARPLFQRLVKFIFDIFKNCVRASSAPITAGPLQKSLLRPWAFTMIYKARHTSCIPNLLLLKMFLAVNLTNDFTAEVLCFAQS